MSVFFYTVLGFDRLPWWGTLLISLGFGVLSALVVWFVVCPRLKKKITRELASRSCEAPLMEKKSSSMPPLKAAPVTPKPSHPEPQTPTATTEPMVFNLGGSVEADLDSKESDTKDVDFSNGLNGSTGLGAMTITDPRSGNSHIVQKDSGLYKDLLHKLHMAKVGDCIGDAVVEERPIRRTNSYTSYTMAIYGLPGGDAKHAEADEEHKRRSRLDSYNSYCSAVTDGGRSGKDGSVFALDVGKDLVAGLEEEEDELEVDKPEVSMLFQFLQILTACFGSFAHGGNDVSNAIGPLVALWLVYESGSVTSSAPTPIWLLLYGGVGICAGLWVWGRRVIQTLGKDLTPITPSSGFSIELSSALTVVVASNIGLPVSTTHCKVGSVVAVGWLRSRKAVDWRLFRNIFIAWFVTVPISGLISAAIMALFTFVIL